MKTAIRTLMTATSSILAAWEDLFLDGIPILTGIRMPEGPHYLHAKPEGKSRFYSRVVYLNQSEVRI